ncbi:RIB43A-like with coiled-coils protein 1 [Carassius gibelio]|uniref:RIB43A-like with coiled-coils protein 1 n=1 Tax=Carassius gibelio TaxID=101364 RepID=UPI0022799343|nr:RIB43A-like with coiled-coils protein 1 [Carassius gibelio]XP_052450711.1 RIB43A-like with coiled-coils protein 1 [Carassius gibelio]XP_052451193.1 RIB43A-like with coiled-coils protein 1 [Carassius gibelio]XP_052451194.1 RIB43A-like with coiled-coils protein 1 [Carassius gibelio]
MYKVDLPVDESAQRAVERRRAAEAERKKRIFNSRARVIGVDLRTLHKQREEKQERLEMDKQRDLAHDLLRLSLDESAMQQKKEEEELRRELAQNLAQYRAIHQRAEDSRDADVNYVRQAAPDASISVSDSSLGPASMQVFLGEGMNENEKKRAQMEMNERNLRAQKEEREKQEREQKNRELLTGRELVEKDLRAVQLNALEEECKRAAHIALSHYNQAQAEERMAREQQERLRREGEELAEMQYMVTSDLLTERPEAAKRKTESSAEGPRVLADRWKGMTPQEISEIHRKREEQLLEKERLREMERQRDVAWDYHLTEQARQQEREKNRDKELQRERRIQHDKYNQQLAREQQAHQQYLDKQLYTNRPTVHYFTQFGTSSR